MDNITYTFDVDALETDSEGFFLPLPNTACMTDAVEHNGRTEVRYSRSGLTATLRCEGCEMAHQDILDGIDRRYPDTDTPPSWFDPSYAGESWDSDY